MLIKLLLQKIHQSFNPIKKENPMFLDFIKTLSQSLTADNIETVCTLVDKLVALSEAIKEHESDATKSTDTSVK